jgi:hypothetical protein
MVMPETWSTRSTWPECPDPGDLFMKMWIFIHGAACMSLTGDYDLTDLQTMQLLEHSYYAFYNETTRG